MTARIPQIAVLCAPGSGPWTGLDALDGEAEVMQADTRAALMDAVALADILVCTDFATTWIDDAVARAPKLCWIHATSAGTDAILTPAVVQSDIVVTNARGIFDHAIAEHVVGMILAFAKNLRQTFALGRAREFVHRDTERVLGRHLLVVGAGSIGRQIARYGRGIGLEVSGIARSGRVDDPDFDRVDNPGALFDRLPEADYVAIAAPLTGETRGLFGREALLRMKPSARLINVGRGAIVDTAALIAALDDGIIAGAALDVFEEEPLPADHPLWDMPEVIITAHMAGDFIGWRQALSQQFIDLFRERQAGRPLARAIDKQTHKVAS